ncbi:MAG: ATP-binding protein [Porticoccus sp.]|uniref:sensor histidine kinase n=1 Tax=Porticoccus sp. TaxID=2024853 RepID=UPI0032968B84|tara:strand:+ start:725318 stop:726532 length:1215 start_codon:yes stop_codon:yes gene_type:complete
MNQTEALSASQLEQAFKVFNQLSHQLDTSYRDLEGKVTGLTEELARARSARLSELAEKERLAHRLSSLLSVLPGGVLILDSGYIIRDANPEALELLGEPLIGKYWEAVLARAAPLQQLSGRELELHSGKKISVVSRLLDGSSDHVVLITDVSEIHQLQEQLGRKKRLTALGEMAARLAHQIRTPLSATTLYLAQLARADLKAEQRQRIVGKVNERLGHMGNLLHSMLSFVRGETPVTETILLNQVLQQFEETVRPTLEQHHAVMSIPYVDNSLELVGDLDELVGVLGNLAMNAIEAAKGPVVIDLWVGALNPDWLQIRFRDDGPGIPEELLERIFDPFFTTRAQGTGLGLAVVAMAVSKHGGEISVTNRSTGGLEFVINLPISKPASGTEVIVDEHNRGDVVYE